LSWIAHSVPHGSSCVFRFPSVSNDSERKDGATLSFRKNRDALMEPMEHSLLALAKDPYYTIPMRRIK